MSNWIMLAKRTLATLARLVVKWDDD